MEFVKRLEISPLFHVYVAPIAWPQHLTGAIRRTSVTLLCLFMAFVSPIPPSSQAVVGLFALGSGIFGVTALGMGIMAGIVAVGVAKGELDPSPEVGVCVCRNAPQQYFKRNSMFCGTGVTCACTVPNEAVVGEVGQIAWVPHCRCLSFGTRVPTS